MKVQRKGPCLLMAVLLARGVGCGSKDARVRAVLNENASLAGNLPFNPLQWRVITSAVNKQDSTMSTLYGNDTAVAYARLNQQNDYPLGAVLSLVTWTEQEDERWFGGRIPNRVKSVEFLQVLPGPGQRPAYLYESYEGAPLKKSASQEGLVPHERAAYLLSHHAAVMP